MNPRKTKKILGKRKGKDGKEEGKERKRKKKQCEFAKSCSSLTVASLPIVATSEADHSRE